MTFEDKSHQKPTGLGRIEKAVKSRPGGQRVKPTFLKGTLISLFRIDIVGQASLSRVDDK